MCAAPKGNQNSKKLKTHKLKQEAYNSYCAHLAKGKSKKSWYFIHPELTLTWQTMETYLASSSVDFDPIKKTIAESQGYQEWEEIAEKCAKGQNKAVVPALQMVMRNKFGWDKENTITHSVEPQVRQLLKNWEK